MTLETSGPALPTEPDPAAAEAEPTAAPPVDAEPSESRQDQPEPPETPAAADPRAEAEPTTAPPVDAEPSESRRDQPEPPEMPAAADPQADADPPEMPAAAVRLTETEPPEALTPEVRPAENEPPSAPVAGVRPTAAEPLGVPAAGVQPADTRAVFDPPGDGPLLPDSDELRLNWQRVQASFVDDPRTAVADAADLVEHATQALAGALRQRQMRLRELWGGDGAEPDTERLRITLQRYRAVFDQICRG